jgi:type VI secretion system protein ImpA
MIHQLLRAVAGLGCAPMNVDALLAAISDASPCGEDLSFSADFDAIQELRRADDPTLDQGEWVTALKSADWPAVQAHCERLLTSRSKDLRVAAWLTDANARLGGFAGLAEGITLCTRLCAQYWDGLHPALDDGDAEQRAGNLRWLLTQIEVLAPQLPVLRHNGRALSLHDIAGAQVAARSTDRPDEAGAPSTTRLTPDDVAAARRSTPREFLLANLADAQAALAALADLQTEIDARMGADGPGFSAARQALEEAVHGVERLSRDGSAAPAKAAAPGLAPVVASGVANSTDAAPSGPLRTRAEALQQLRAVADFFRQTEPHSPVAYLADRAAQWGDMPLHAWLRAVVKDPGVLSTMEELLGVPTPPAQG